MSKYTSSSDQPNRRRFLSSAYNGIGALALSNMLAADSRAATNPLAPKRPHLNRKAKNCIFLFMQGGVSQMDSFEHAVVGSAFKFKKHGQSERHVSELFPYIAQHVDDLAFIHGIKTDNQNHGPSTLHVTTGNQFPGSPSVGSWVNYGLGTQNQNLPGYIVIQDPRGAPVNGAAVWANGYLPAAFQGTLLRPTGSPILNLNRQASVSAEQQRREFDALKALNTEHLASRPGSTELEARISAYELAFRMQTAAPELVDISDEPEHVRELYGLNDEATKGFGRQCLLARRFVEAGVRHTLLIHGVQIGSHSWDDHGNVEGGMRKHSREVDRPVAGLLSDLKQRGLLDETLVVWASEMGRTPFVNGKLGKTPGREHNSHSLTMWMAGGDIKGGATAGETDEFSLRSVDDEPISIRDVHATILSLMGLDDEELRYLHAGRLRQLTDIGGYVLDDIIA